MITKKLTWEEKIIGLDDLTIGDFWSWAYSDVLCNINRSVFAEFVVGSALGVTDTPRIEWNAVDLYYRDKKLEVKAAAYLQSWQQKTLSQIKFDIGKKKAWSAETNTYATKPVRSADCYVFCLYPETDTTKVNILDVTRWQFHVLSTDRIEQELGAWKNVGLKRIQALCQPVGYDMLKACIDTILGLTE